MRTAKANYTYMRVVAINVATWPVALKQEGLI